MKSVTGSFQGSQKKPFVKPELVELDVRGTQTAVPDDPNEFNPIIGPTS